MDLAENPQGHQEKEGILKEGIALRFEVGLWVHQWDKGQGWEKKPFEPWDIAEI